MRCTNYGTLTQDEELNENEKAMLYIKECAELVGLEVIEDKTAFSINFIAKIMKRLRKEPKTGHWIEEDVFDGDVAYRCSECNELFWIESGTPKDNEYNFCPKCGAKMESEVKNE